MRRLLSIAVVAVAGATLVLVGLSVGPASGKSDHGRLDDFVLLDEPDEFAPPEFALRDDPDEFAPPEFALRDEPDEFAAPHYAEAVVGWPDDLPRNDRDHDALGSRAIGDINP